MLEYDQTLSFFATVLRGDVVPALEEKSRRIQVGEFEVSKREKAYVLYDCLLELLRTEFKDR